jgi:hypothetical protein
MECWRSKCDHWTTTNGRRTPEDCHLDSSQRHEWDQYQPELATCNLLLNLQRADGRSQLLTQSEMERPGTIDTDHLENRVRPQKNAWAACSSSGSCIV